MANSFKRAMALTLAAAMVATAVPATNFGTVSADAASYKVTGTTAPYAKTTNKYVIKGLKKGMYAKVSVTGNAKSKVTVKQGSKKIKASTKIKGTGKNITLKVTNKAAAGKKYNVVVKYFSKKGKQVKKITKKATIYAQTTSVTITPVTGAAITGASINVTGASIQVGTSITLTAAKTPEKNTKKITWKSSDAKVAKVVDGVVTALGAGKATITATSGKASASYEVTVDDSNVAAKIVASGCKQAAADKITLAFDKSAKTLTREDLTVQREDKSEVIPVQTVVFSEDGKTATVSLTKALTDKVKYVVSQKNDADTFAFEAQVGAPASFLFKTSTAEKGAKTPIEYAVLDATGMDVTAAITNKKGVITAEIADGSKGEFNNDVDDLWIKMDTVDDKATITLKYEKDQVKFNQAVTIVCVKASEKKGTPMFAQGAGGDINGNSNCYEFYKKMSTTPTAIHVTVGGSDNNVYFTAVDNDTKMGIKYDSYEAETADKNTAEVTVEESNESFVKLNVSGNKTGTTQINLKATLNGATTTYTIPVEVRAARYISSVKTEISRSTMTNTYDEMYYSKVKVKAYDQFGDELKVADGVSFSIEPTGKNDTWESFAKNTITLTDDENPANDYITGFNKSYENAEGNEYWFTASGSKGKTYNMTVTGEYENKSKTASVSIKVEEIDPALWNATASNKSVKYEVEMFDGRTTLDAGDGDKDHDEALLAAKVGGKFVGYVRRHGGETIIGSVVYEKPDPTGVVVIPDAEIASGATSYFAVTAAPAHFRGFSGKTVEVASGRAMSQYEAATVASGVAFVLEGFDDTTADMSVINDMNIVPCSGGVVMAADGAGTAVSDSVVNYNNNANWVVISGKTIYVNINDGNGEAEHDAGSIAAVWNSVPAVVTGTAVPVAGARGENNISGAVITAVATDAADEDESFGDVEEINVGVYNRLEDDDWNSVVLVYDPYLSVASNAALLNENSNGCVEIEALDLSGVPAGDDIDGLYDMFDDYYDGILSRRGVFGEGMASEWIDGDLYAGVSKNSKYSKGNLYNYDTNFATTNANKASAGSELLKDDGEELLDDLVYVPVEAANDNWKVYVADSSCSYDWGYAKTGSYTVEFGCTYLDSNSNTKVKSLATKSITVTNSIYVPTVYAPKLSLNEVDSDTIKDAIYASVDMNNNESYSKSISSDFYGKWNAKDKRFEDAEEKSGNMYVAYFEVENGDGVTVLVPFGKSFTKKS